MIKTTSSAIRLLVTGGAGFIGSALIRHLIRSSEVSILNIDKLTYAGNLESLSEIDTEPRYRFVQADITDRATLSALFDTERPTGIIHLAAESHVDRSIDGPSDFIQTNIVGTYTLLEVARAYWMELAESDKSRFRLLHVSTDEVFGSLSSSGYFTEETAYHPNSPYSASKAASDHLVRAWHHTFGLPIVITNCSNNYGPYQFPEKLIPLIILNALEGKPLPVYGEGKNIRDWIYVDDHADALWTVFQRGGIGETYVIGGGNEKTNLEVVESICDWVDEMTPKLSRGRRRSLIRFVTDRPGHDFRYAIDAGKIRSKLGWRPSESFETGLRKTVNWYLTNSRWIERVRDGTYRERLGLGTQVPPSSPR